MKKGATPVLNTHDPYYEDDTAAAEFEKTLVEGADDYSAYNFGDHALIYSIDGLYTPDGDLESMRALKTVPPILRVRGQDQDQQETEISLILTPEVTRDLHTKLEATLGAFRGVDTRHQEKPFTRPWVRYKTEQTLKTVRTHPVITVFLTLIIVLTLWGIINT